MTGRHRTTAHPGRVGAVAEQQQQAGDDHGLARTGLAGHDGQPVVEGQDGVVDDAEASDAELFEHVWQASRSRRGLVAH